MEFHIVPGGNAEKEEGDFYRKGSRRNAKQGRAHSRIFSAVLQPLSQPSVRSDRPTDVHIRIKGGSRDCNGAFKRARSPIDGSEFS
jgi:hypothetical protein